MAVEAELITPVDGPEGRYTDYNGLLGCVGQQQLDDYSNWGDETRMPTNQQRAIDWAESEIDRRFNQSGIATPIASSNANFLAIADAAALLAICWLYRSRGVTDASKKMAGKMEENRLQALNVIDNLCVPGRIHAGPAPATESPNPTVVYEQYGRYPLA